MSKIDQMFEAVRNKVLELEHNPVDATQEALRAIGQELDRISAELKLIDKPA